MTYRETVQFLYSLGNEVKTMKLGLEVIGRICEALDHPERAYPVIHVAGTNGKGSVCSMLDAALRADGKYTGLYTSPHLIEATERIQIDGRPISESKFVAAFEAVEAAIERCGFDLHPTYFEVVTAMAFWCFRDAKVDIAVLETGLGGRLDATNIVQPILTVITPIDLEHQKYLGDTLTLIAGEKAGILKPGVPTVFALQTPEADAVLTARAESLGCPIHRSSEFPITNLELHSRGARFSGLEIALAGEHQVDNAATAVVALQQLGISPKGIADATWPGRLEVVAPNPDVLLDGAHNPAGVRTLVKYLDQFYKTRRRWIIFGVMNDKAIEEVASILFPVANKLIFTAVGDERAVMPSALRTLAGRGQIAPDIKAAVDMVLKQVNADDLIVITGSLYLVGEARKLFLHTTLGRW